MRNKTINFIMRDIAFNLQIILIFNSQTYFLNKYIYIKYKYFFACATFQFKNFPQFIILHVFNFKKKLILYFCSIYYFIVKFKS